MNTYPDDILLTRSGPNNAGTRYMIAALNLKDRLTGGSEQTVTFYLPACAAANATVTVQFENRTIAASNGSFTDTFAGYARHVYTFPASTTTRNGKTSYASGWWFDSDEISFSSFDGYVAGGQTCFKMDGFFNSLDQLPDKQAWLAHAGSQGVKVWASLNSSYAPGYAHYVSPADIGTAVNGMKNYAALLGYCTGDEPNLAEGHNLDEDAAFDAYNAAIRAADPNHPTYIPLGWISTDYPTYFWEEMYEGAQRFFSKADVIGWHIYAFDPGDEEFEGGCARLLYDQWKRYYTDLAAIGKPFIATGQGYVDDGARLPTEAENLWQVYSAVLLGVETFMWWLDSWGIAAGMGPLVDQASSELQAIAEELSNGVTNDPAILTGEGGSTDMLTASDLAGGAPACGSPAVGQAHVLTASLTIGAVALGRPSMALPVGLTANELTSGAAALGSPAVGQAHVLPAATFVLGAAALGLPALAAVGLLAGRERVIVIEAEDRVYAWSEKANR